MDKFYKRPANTIMLMAKKAKKIEDNGLGAQDFDYCIGEEIDGFYVVKFGIEGSDISKTLYFDLSIKKVINGLVNIWIDNPILNRSGLSSMVWDCDKEGKTPNELRRRLEQKAARNTFTEEEKQAILKSVLKFVDEVRESIK